MNILPESLIAEVQSFDEVLKWMRVVEIETGVKLGEIQTSRDILSGEMIVSFPQYPSLETRNKDGRMALEGVVYKLYSDKLQNGCFMNLVEQ